METSWFSRLWKRANEPLGKLTAGEFLSLIRVKAKEIITIKEIENLLKKKRTLKIKFGVDPTGSELHLGHAVPLMLLRLFQRAGHEAHFIIGDFTAQIGDPSGQTDKRSDLSARDTSKNMKSYKKQISPIINLKKAKIHKNSKWLEKMQLADFLKVTSAVSFGEVAQREDFRARIRLGSGVSLREANYSSLMAVDSLQLNPDIEVGGIDQLLNFMQTREIMSAFGKKSEVVLVTPMIEGTAGDGRKMSKSFNNYIALGAAAPDQFGLVMSIPDKLLVSYFTSFGDVFEEEIHELDSYIGRAPLEAKKELGMLIVALFHGEKQARKAREDFEHKFSSDTKELAPDASSIKTILIPGALGIIGGLYLAFEGVRSKSDVRRLLLQGAIRKVETNGERKTIFSDQHGIVYGDVYEVGKQNILFRFQKK